MTKKDFQLIANAINSLSLPIDTKETVAKTFAAYLRTTNPRFDQFRFIEACIGSPK